LTSVSNIKHQHKAQTTDDVSEHFEVSSSFKLWTVMWYDLYVHHVVGALCWNAFLIW